jgi:ubiquinone biosynthesis accessory factor UbiJ
MTNSSLEPRELPFAREIAVLLERALNREIEASTAASDLVAELEGRSFAIDVAGLRARCVLRCVAGHVAVEPSIGPNGAAAHAAHASSNADASKAPDATLRATPLDLLRLLRAADVASLKGTGAQLSGAPEIAEAFAKVLKLARPDLEELVARWLGDVPAHAIGRAARGASDWLRRAAEALRMNTAEFLQEESRALPAALEAQAFYADVERLRDDVERAAARLARLDSARSR